MIGPLFESACLTMDLRFARRTGLFLVVLTFLSLPHGSREEIPPKPSPGVTILPPVKPDGGPQAFPDAEKANLPVFTMDYPRIQIPFEITLWVLLASFAKIGEFPSCCWCHRQEQVWSVVTEDAGERSERRTVIQWCELEAVLPL